jgi:hypothetical protein
MHRHGTGFFGKIFFRHVYEEVPNTKGELAFSDDVVELSTIVDDLLKVGAMLLNGGGLLFKEVGILLESSRPLCCLQTSSSV